MHGKWFKVSAIIIVLVMVTGIGYGKGIGLIIGNDYSIGSG